MYCGVMREEVANENLKDFLERFKDIKEDVKININGSSKFYIHYDMDGNSINIDVRPLDTKYGERGINNKCSRCTDFKNGTCKCKKEDCMNWTAFKNEGFVKEKSNKNVASNDIENATKDAFKSILSKMIKSLDE